MNRTPVVDAHQHFWLTPTADKYPGLSGDRAAIRRRFGPEDLRPLLAVAGVDRTIVVQSRPSYDESLELLEIAGGSGFVAGVVAWVDFARSDVPAQLDHLRSSPHGELVVGVRHHHHNDPNPRWLLESSALDGLAAIAEANLAYDLLVREPQLPAALAVARAFPELRFVIDHLAKPRIASGCYDAAWANAMAPLSECANVSCKLSGLVTEANWRSWRIDDLAPYARSVIEWFGVDRVMFGSDWPVCLLAASYHRVVAAVRALLSDLSADQLTQIFGTNAVRVYRIDSARMS